MWPTKDTKSVLAKWHHGMICTSHLHVQYRFMSSGLTNTDSKNRPVLGKRLDVLSLFKSLVFLQIKTSLVFHGWFKNVCAIQSVLLSQAGPEVSSFIMAVFSGFVGKA